MLSNGKTWFPNDILKALMVDNYDTSDASFGNIGKRQADKLADFINDMSQLARIANGVALQNGLADGSIAADDVIAEFLRMGSVKPQDLAAIDTEKLKTAINELATLAEALEVNDLIKSHENGFLALEKMRLSPVIDTSNLPGMAEYKATLEAINLNTITSKLTGLKTESYNLKGAMEQVELVTDDIGTVNAFAISALKTGFEQAEQDAQAFNDVMTLIANLKKLCELSNFLHPIFQEVLNRNDVIYAFDTAAETTIHNNIEKLKQSGSGISTHLGAIGNLDKLLASRQLTHHPSQAVPTTSGFSNGFNDLDKLEQDAQSNLLSAAGKLSSDGGKTLRQALDPLGPLKSSFESLDSSWTNAAGSSAGPLLEVLGDGKKLIGEASADRTVQEAIMAQMKKCNEFFPTAVVLTDPSAMQVSIDKLNEEILKLSSFEYIEKFKDLKAYKDAVVSFKNAAAGIEKAEAQKLALNLKTFPDYKEMLQFTKDYEKDIVSLQNFVQKFSTLAGPITNGFNKVNSYLTLLTNTYIKNYNCLRDKVQNGDELAKGIRLAKEIRGLKGLSKVTDTMKFVDDIGQTMSSLTELQTKVTGTKPSDGDLENIKLFTDATTTAQSFGLAVDGLIALKKVKENKAELTSLQNEIATVKAEADKFRGRLSTDDYQEIGKLGTLIGELEAMYTGIDQFETAVGNLTPTTIPDYFVAFQAAQAVPSITIDVGKIKKALDKLALLSAGPTTGGGTGGGGGGTRKKRAPSPIDPAVTSLQNLESLELNFANFPFASASTPLASLDSFFTAMTGALQAQAAQNGPGGSGPAGAPEEAPGAGKLGGSDQEEQSSGSFRLGLFVGVMIIFAIAGIGAGIYYYLHKKKTIGKGQKTQKSSKSSKKEPEQGFEEISDPLTPRQNIQK